MADPVVNTNEATNVTDTAGTMEGECTDFGSYSSLDWFFKYGTSESLDSETSKTSADDPIAFSTELSGLSTGATIYYQAAVTDGSTVWTGSTKSFTTGSVTYNVTYDPNGADSGSVPTDSTDYSSGDTVTVKDNTGDLDRTDATWEGWNTNADGSGTTYVGGDTFTIDSDVTLYAYWSDSDTTTAPTVSTEAATNVTASEGTMEGAITDLGDYSSVDYYFKYGNTTDLGTESSKTSTSSPINFSLTLSELSADETIHYQAAATDGSSVWTGDTKSFTTESSPVEISVPLAPLSVSSLSVVAHVQGVIKSAIFDCADTHDPEYPSMAIRSIEFLDYNDNVISLTEANGDFTAYATSYDGTDFHPKNVFDTSLSKTGEPQGVEWGAKEATSQRLIIVFAELQDFEKIRVNNRHISGTTTANGVKNVDIYTSENEITNTVFEADRNLYTSRGSFVLDRHADSDSIDNQIITLQEAPTPISLTIPISFVVLDALQSHHQMNPLDVPVASVILEEKLLDVQSSFKSDLEDVDETQSDFQEGTLTDVAATSNDTLELALTLEEDRHSETGDYDNGSNGECYQELTMQKNATIASLTFLADVTGTYSAEFQDSDGNTLASSDSVDATTAGEWLTFELNTPVSAVEGTTYRSFLYCPSSADTRYVWDTSYSGDLWSGDTIWSAELDSISPAVLACGLVEEKYVSSGNRISPQLGLSDINVYADSLIKWTASYFTTMLEFKDYSDNVDCEDLGAMPTRGTIEMWVSTDVLADYYGAFTTDRDSSDYNSIIFEENADGQFLAVIGDTSTRTTHVFTNSLQVKTWVHVALGWDFEAGNVKGFFNGSLIFDEVQSEIPDDMSAVVIGVGLSQTTDRTWQGRIADVRIWKDTVRTQAEIQDNMNKRLTGSETNLYAYYKLDDASGSTATDSAGSNDASVNGPVWKATKDLPFLNEGVAIETRYSLDDGSSWSDWQTATNGSAIPGLSKGDEMFNALLECRQSLSTIETDLTPDISKLEIYLAGSHPVYIQVPPAQVSVEGLDFVLPIILKVPPAQINVEGLDFFWRRIIEVPSSQISINEMVVDKVIGITINPPTANVGDFQGLELFLDTTTKHIRRLDMTISVEDVKFRKSIRQTDTVNNGGPLGDALVVSGARHNLFPRVTKAERTNGVTKYRKQFWCNENPDDYPAFGVMIFLEFPSTGGDYFAICKGTQEDTQSDIGSDYVFGGIGKLDTALSGGETQVDLMMDDDTLEFYNGDYLHLADKVKESQTIGPNVRVGDSVEETDGTWNKISATTDIEYPRGVYLGDNAVLTYEDSTNEEWVPIAKKQTADAVIGTGDGSTTQVTLDSLSITNPIQGKRELAPVVKATCNGSTEEVHINPDGTCSGFCSGGELNLDDGTWATQITWQEAPDNNIDITITYCEVPYTYSGNVATVELDDSVGNSYSTTTTYGSACIYEDEVAVSYDSFSVDTAGDGTYDESNNPPILYNDGTEREDWTIQFENGSSFTCTGSRISGLDNGSLGSDYSPTNPETGQPYFTLSSAGWSGTFQSGDTITFSTYPSALPVWMKEVVPANTDEESRNLLVCGYYTE